MIVADVNVLLALELESADNALAKRVLAQDADLRLPKLWRWEFANVLRTFFHARRISAEAALEVLEGALERYRPCEIEQDEAAVLALAMQSGQSFYDACYLELARRLGVSLITQDKALIAAGQGTALGMAAWLAQNRD